MRGTKETACRQSGQGCTVRFSVRRKAEKRDGCYAVTVESKAETKRKRAAGCLHTHALGGQPVGQVGARADVEGVEPAVGGDQRRERLQSRGAGWAQHAAIGMAAERGAATRLNKTHRHWDHRALDHERVQPGVAGQPGEEQLDGRGGAPALEQRRRFRCRVGGLDRGGVIISSVPALDNAAALQEMVQPLSTPPCVPSLWSR